MKDADGWAGLHVRHLAALKAVAEEGTFAGAAESLGYTQSALSQQIAALERIVGKTLLDRPRGRRPTGLTPAGAVMIRHADAILARLQVVQADLAAAGDGTTGKLRLGTYQSIGIHLLPSLLPRFSAAWPQVEVELRESASDYELLDLVERGELDLTFCVLPLEAGPFAAVELLADPYVLVLPLDSPLAGRRRLTVRDVAALPLIGFRSCRNEHRIEAQLRAGGLEPSMVFRSDDNATLQALVAAGMGAALMPRLTVDMGDRRTVRVDVGELFSPRLLGVVWHSDREPSPAVSAFVELAQEHCLGGRHADELPVERGSRDARDFIGGNRVP
jgi:DNA-binding transcriptional LysR family regulator